MSHGSDSYCAIVCAVQMFWLRGNCTYNVRRKKKKYTIHKWMHVFVCICYVMFAGFVWWFIRLTSMSTKFNWRTNVKNTKIITYFAIAWSNINTNTPKNYMLHLFPIWTISKFTASKNRSQNKWIINFHLVAYCFQHFVNYLRHTCTTTKHFNFRFIHEIDKATTMHIPNNRVYGAFKCLGMKPTRNFLFQ